MKTKVCRKYFVNDCLWKTFFASDLPQIPSNFISFLNFVTLRPFTEFSSKIQETELKKCANISFTWQLLF